MSVAPGTRDGPYEILAAIGPGGMGEVYRARDRSILTWPADYRGAAFMISVQNSLSNSGDAACSPI
jgi:hypothetical protein